jgi:3-oxoacyl-[acyl-carrier-protein] synthase-3
MSHLSPRQPVYLDVPSAYLPPRVVRNAELIQLMGAEFRPSWIKHKCGVDERRWVDDGVACSDIGCEAARMALAVAPGRAVTQVVLCTVSGDHVSPPTAPAIQHRLGLTGVGAFDLGAACAGFVSGLHVAGALSDAAGDDVLVVAAEIRSKFLNLKDFSTAVLFGDGAAATRVSRAPAALRLVASQLFADGEVGDVIAIPDGGSRTPLAASTDPARRYLVMKDGAGLFLRAVDGMSESGRQFLERLGMTPGDVQWLVPHQANIHLVTAVGERLGIPAERTSMTISFTGNTSGASVGIALQNLYAKHPVARGDKILCLSAGGGGMAACALLEAQ